MTVIIFFFVSGKFALSADVDGTSQYHNEEKDHIVIDIRNRDAIRRLFYVGK